ncbi:PAS domain-containing sensor histidine kinase [Rhizobium sp. GR12]|uniref:PAS domain-containing sensor histidine kinase n=1 Tax=Rhizobium sp. GR12 TaxID=3053925 RepID=UPI002FBEF31E
MTKTIENHHARRFLVAAACLGSAVLYWLTASQALLLVPVVALACHATRRSLLIVMTFWASALAGGILIASTIPAWWHHEIASWISLFSAALCICLFLMSRTPTRESEDHDIAPKRNRIGPQALNEKFLKTVHPEDRDVVSQASSRAFWSGFPQIVRYRQLQPDGSYGWGEFRAEPGYEIAGDTPAKISAQHLPWSIANSVGETAEAARIALVLETLFGTGWSMDTSGRFTYATPNAQTTVGQTLEQMNERLTERDFLEGGDLGWKEMFHPDEYERVAHSLRQSLTTGNHWNNEYRLRRVSTGEYGWHRVAMRPTRDQEGRITGWYGMSIDITVYKQTEAALRLREQELSQLVNMVPVHIMRLDGDGRPTFISKATFDFFALGDEFAENPLAVLEIVRGAIHPDDLARLSASLRQAMTTHERVAIRWRVRRFDGTYRWMDSRAEPIRDTKGAIIEWYAVSLDVNDQVLAQEELRVAQENLARSSQAANLAELSASIAHEVAQPLAALLSSSEACQLWLATDPPNVDRALQALERIVRSGRSATDIVRRIRGLFAQSPEARGPTDLPAVIGEARELLSGNLQRHRVKLEVELGEDIPTLNVDRVQMQQVFINLMRNGIESVATSDSERILTVRVRQNGQTVHTTISDTGAGIGDSAKIFEPFFTTKEHGMGMGLAICRSIVTSHGGELWAEKNEPHGATFVFTLPMDHSGT